MSQKRSSAWNHFVFNLERSKTICQVKNKQNDSICGYELKYNKNTSAMTTHLYSIHKINIKDEEPNANVSTINK